MNDFDALLAELNTHVLLSKAQAPEGDEKVAEAAAEAGAELPGGGTGEAEGAAAGGDGEGAGELEGGEDDALLGKSFSVTMPDGTVTEAYDGTEMMKAMSAEVDGLRIVAADQASQLEAARADLTKALSASTGLLGLVREQGALLKSLQSEVKAYGNSGRGRTTTVSLVDKPGAAAPAAPAAPTGEVLMAKAMSLFGTGEFSGADVARVEANVARSGTVPADLLRRLGVAA